MVKVNIEVDIYNMKDGKLVDFFYNDILYKPDGFKNKPEPNIQIDDIKKIVNKTRSLKKSGAKNIVMKYILEKKLNVLDLEQFYKDNPNYRLSPKRVEKYIKDLITDKKIIQNGTKFIIGNIKGEGK